MTTLRRTSGTIGLFVALATALSGCAAIEGIFKAGLWVGVIGVLLLVAMIGGLVALAKR